MSVPETAIGKNSYFSFGKNKIRFAIQWVIPSPSLYFEFPEYTNEFNLS